MKTHPFLKRIARLATWLIAGVFVLAIAGAVYQLIATQSDKTNYLDLPVHFLHGNGELAILALLSAPHEGAVTYWGTTSGEPLPEHYRPAYRSTAQQLQVDEQPLLARWPKTLRLEIEGLLTAHCFTIAMMRKQQLPQLKRCSRQYKRVRS